MELLLKRKSNLRGYHASTDSKTNKSRSGLEKSDLGPYFFTTKWFSSFNIKIENLQMSSITFHGGTFLKLFAFK